MKEVRSAAQEAAEDIFFGQAVIIWARWFVIAAVTFAVLWSSSSVSEMTMAVVLVVALIAVNFFVHGRYLMEKPVNQVLLIGLSLVDLVVITLFIMFWQEPNGFESQFYVFYYPIILAFAFVFRARISVGYTLLTLIIYVGACLLVDYGFVEDVNEIKGMAIRLITMASMGGLGTYYWRIQRGRRREAATGQHPAPMVTEALAEAGQP